MLRIFGYYKFNNLTSAKNIVRDMTGLPETKSQFTKFEFFEFENLFLAYESINSNESNRYFFVNKNKKQSCFIVGNIFAYEKEKLEVLSDKNVAEFILDKYKKDGFCFLQYLRGEFNAIIIDKKNLYLINDKLGLSAMYICKTKNGIIFCSEAEPIILLGNNNCINFDSIAEFLVYGFVPSGQTFIKNIFNQPPATIFCVEGKNFIKKRYFTLELFPMLNSVNIKERAKFVNNLFLESVKIRIPERDLLAQELSGGWDTRFVLANLLSLNLSPAAITFLNTSRKDIYIAKYLAKKFKIQHCIINEWRSSIDRAFDYNFRLFKRNFFSGSRNISLLEKIDNNAEVCKNLLLKKFSGLCGTEVLGFAPLTFIKVFRKNFSSEARTTLPAKFLSRLESPKQLKLVCNRKFNNIAYLYLTQYLRSYWNVYFNFQRDRVFDFFYLHPFVDSKFVGAMSSIDYKVNGNYKLYTEMYSQYNDEFLEIPYTFREHRRANTLREAYDSEYDKEQKIFTNIAFNNLNFLKFLTNVKIFKKRNQPDYNSLKKLYCLFSWYESYKSLLNHKDSWIFLNKSFGKKQ